MRNVRLWATWARYVILTKLGQHVNEMMAVAGKKFKIFSGHVFL